MIHVWDLGTKQCLRTIKISCDHILRLCVIDENRVACSLQLEKSIKILNYNKDSNFILTTLENKHYEFVLVLNQLITCSSIEPFNIIVYDLSKFECVKTLNGHMAQIGSLDLKTNDSTQLLMSTSFDKTLCMWNLNDGNKTKFDYDMGGLDVKLCLLENLF